MSNLNGTLKGTQKHYIWTNEWERIYLSAPSWDCGWYWGFWYLGNRNCHYHLNGLTKIETYNTEKKVFEYEFVNLYDWIKKHFTDLQITDKKLRTFCELVSSAYKLKETAEVLGRGGSHYTNNPCQDIIKNEAEAKRINEVVLPAIFLEIEKCFITDDDIEKIKELKAKKERLESKLKESKELLDTTQKEILAINRELEAI